jgi:hypothetical protein
MPDSGWTPVDTNIVVLAPGDAALVLRYADATEVFACRTVDGSYSLPHALTTMFATIMKDHPDVFRECVEAIGGPAALGLEDSH